MPKKDQWQLAIDRMIEICDEMMKGEDYPTSAIIALLQERLVKLKSEPH